MYRNTPENVNGGGQSTVHTGKIECQFSIHLLSACLLPRSIYQKGGGRGQHIHSSHTHDSHWTNKKKKKSTDLPTKLRAKSLEPIQKFKSPTSARRVHNFPESTQHTPGPGQTGLTCAGSGHTELRVYGSRWRHSLAVSRWLTDRLGGKTESAERSGHYSTTHALQERWYELDSTSDRLYMTERLNFAQKKKEKTFKGKS